MRDWIGKSLFGLLLAAFLVLSWGSFRLVRTAPSTADTVEIAYLDHVDPDRASVLLPEIAERWPTLYGAIREQTGTNAAGGIPSPTPSFVLIPAEEADEFFGAYGDRESGRADVVFGEYLLRIERRLRGIRFEAQEAADSGEASPPAVLVKIAVPVPAGPSELIEAEEWPEVSGLAAAAEGGEPQGPDVLQVAADELARRLGVRPPLPVRFRIGKEVFEARAGPLPEPVAQPMPQLRRTFRALALFCLLAGAVVGAPILRRDFRRGILLSRPGAVWAAAVAAVAAGALGILGILDLVLPRLTGADPLIGGPGVAVPGVIFLVGVFPALTFVWASMAAHRIRIDARAIHLQRLYVTNSIGWEELKRIEVRGAGFRGGSGASRRGIRIRQEMILGSSKAGLAIREPGTARAKAAIAHLLMAHTPERLRATVRRGVRDWMR